ncbi:ABC-three component system protein [Streptomyces sp. ISL-44]|uniref:ABC-three component system protein n=1 Tax=Streptomyces sp. ISL-44 TaxID=2819184 RepID=UPI001BEB92CE|nr:ABC-three component system protein [Streptomyces sp. ISL-44]
MAEGLEPGKDGERPVLEGLPEPKMPAVVVATPSAGAPELTPQQRLFFYDDVQWEEFTVEWVHALGRWAGRPYLRVKRMGGAGDRGADVAACLTPQGTAGEWHCYQCKHYSDPVTGAHAWPEIVKIFTAKVLGQYELPTRYVFVAPKIGQTLERLLLNPPKLKEEFFKAWVKKDSKLGKDLKADVREAVEKLAQATDFCMFEAPELGQILELHATTPYHVWRFPKPLKQRPAAEPAPPDQEPHEAVYVRKLLDAYNEKHSFNLESLQQAREHAQVNEHLARQRQAFFSAEALRVFARDSVPDLTYQEIETDLHDVVIETAGRDFPRGHDRLDAVLGVAATHQPNPHNILSAAIKARDRMGLCHHFANDGRLTWCKEEPQ